MPPEPNPTSRPVSPPDPIHLYGWDEAVFEVYLHEPTSSTPPVPEAIVHDLWRTQQFDARGLCTSTGLPIAILDPGTFNRDGGPDFRNARIRIAGQTWHGDVEIHTTSRVWNEHRHDADPRYNSVILHVVLYDDGSTGTLLRADGSLLPEAVLAPRLTAPLRTLLHRFYSQHTEDIACRDGWPAVPARVRSDWIEELALERIRSKTQHLASAYLSRPDLESLLYELLMAGLGYAKNTAPMLSLARRIPLSVARSLPDAFDLEALYLGTAGLLPTPAELFDADRETSDYAMELRNRYDQLRLRLSIPPMPKASWQFFRLRPLNFPPLRIAQAVALVRAEPPGLLRQDSIGLLEAALLGPDPIEALHRLLAAEPAPFWQSHVRLERASRPHPAALGRRRAEAIIVNAVIPILLLHADQVTHPRLEERAIEILRRIPAEQDEITRKYERLGTNPGSAFHTQGLHQLYRTRCREAHCLTCPIGRHILGS